MWKPYDYRKPPKPGQRCRSRYPMGGNYSNWNEFAASDTGVLCKGQSQFGPTQWEVWDEEIHTIPTVPAMQAVRACPCGIYRGDCIYHRETT